TSEKEKYLRNSGKIEGLPSQNELSKIGRSLNETDKNDSSHLTDRSGEEEKEDYINTDERKRDLDKRGF
ncbi:MAG TPA: hypothetical protein VM101_01620, partial [Flavitalea sp.]|nr:hypothetical protein [Flavitalea sp.]